MKAFVLAAGLGTRLRPWTLEHPKALVPVAGVPMLRRVLDRMRDEGFDRVTVNVHHFADQIKDYVKAENLDVFISDETDRLLDTGGGILHAASYLAADASPFLVHNVDILSDAPLREIMRRHVDSGRDISLLTSARESSRKLMFDDRGILCGWHNLGTGERRPAGIEKDIDLGQMHEHAFSGIYVMNPSVLESMGEYSRRHGSTEFPVMDFFLDTVSQGPDDKEKRPPVIGEIFMPSLRLIDIGKPDTLAQACELFS